MRKNHRRLLAVAAAVTIACSALAPLMVRAATQNQTAAAHISLTFDDGLASTYNLAEPILSSHGLVGTDYVITGCVGMTTVPNTCRANTDAPYMTWAQIQALQNTYGWEIGSHTVDHDCLASSARQDPDDCQTKTLTTAQVDQELSGSKAALAANGINATDFAPPYGDFSNNVLAEIAKYYASMRQFKNAADNANVWPDSDYYLQDYTVQEKTDTVASIEAKINTAIVNNNWLVLTFHDIQAKPSQNPEDYQYGSAELDQIAAYVAAKQAAGLIKSTTVSSGLVTSDTNMLPNGSFNDGIADGWTTDSPATIKKDTGTHGSYPDPTNSIAFSSNTTAETHLFSPTVSVSPTTSYLFKSYLNLAKVTKGDVGYYVDEYDANGNWISGQYRKVESSAFVEEMNFTYTPTSVNVSKASLQIIVGGTGVSGYLDNVQMFPTSNTTTTGTNLLTGGTFDQGISGGWTTDSASTITADSASNGSPNNVVNSVKLTSTSNPANTHLFSPRVSVNSTHTYNLINYADVKAISSGEVGFYVDEYDLNGDWISGQYKTGVRSVSSGDVGFSYTPSSSNVATASLQVIVVGNSGITGYFDDARWYQAN